MKSRLIWIFILLFLLVGIASASPLHQQDAIPPSVIETVPFIGEELLLDQTITLYFDQAMDQASVEDALTLRPDPALLGELAWEDDLTLTITPAETWPRDTELIFSIGTSATTADGAAFEDDYKLTYNTIGYLSIAEVLPTDGEVDVDANNIITVIFNRPVVPLVSIEEQEELPSPITIDPPIAGEGEWLNTSIYIFRPSDGLLGGLTHTVTVPAGLTDVTGAVLENDFSWSFTTLLPRVTSVEPRDGAEQVALTDPIEMRFTQKMDPATTEAAISITDTDNVAVAGSFAWNTNFTEVVFTPAANLELGTEYDVFVDATVATSDSGANLSANWISRFISVPYPAIIRTSPSDGNESAEPYGGFAIYFNAPVDVETIEDKILIDPEPWRDYDTYYYSYDTRYSLFFDIEPSTEYTITILPGITDPYGNEITETTVVNYTTSPYPPAVNLNAPGLYGFYNAYNVNTRLFATHRNVSELNLNLYEMDSLSLARFLGNNGWEYRRDYVPLDTDFLRSWTVDVQSQPNRYRYELLLLSEEGGDGIENIQCLGAPDSRLSVGDIGQVTFTDPRPLRVRSLPNLTGEILTEIDPGATFEVVGGPICADGYLWWNISLDEGLVEGWSAEGTLENYFVEVVERRGAVVDVSDPSDFPALEPGIYFMTMSSPETRRQGYNNLDHVAVIADTTISLKFTPDQALAWVTDIQTGEPVADTPITFYDFEFEPIGRMTTDADGLAMLDMPRLSSLYTDVYAEINTDERFGFVHSKWDDGLDPWRFDVRGDYEPEDFSVYLYTDRPIYRPDQPVYFRGVVRNRDDVEFTIPRGIEEVPVTVYDPRDQIVFEGVLPVTPYGTFSGEFELDAGAALGFYRINAGLSSNRRSAFSLGFSVAEYDAPEFQVNVTPAENQVVQGDTIEVMVDSSYFFGGAVSDADISWTALSKNYFYDFEGPGRYDFIDYNYDAGPGEYYSGVGERIADGEGITDDQGRFMIELPADLGTRTQSQSYTIEARVVDESDQLVAGRAEVVVHQGEVYVGLQPERYISRADEETVVNVIAADWESVPVQNQVIEYRVVERRWSSVMEEDELGRTVWTWEVEEILLEDGQGVVATRDNGQAQITFTPPEGGVYKVYATARDSLGNRVTTSTFIWVTGSNYVSWRQQNSNRFDLITDADDYEVGDTAEILIASPFQGESTALITVERGGILMHDVMHMETNSAVYRLPITGDFAPNVFVSVMLVKGVDENTPYAEFRMGMAQLNVDTERLNLNIDVSANVDVEAGEFAGPGDEVTYSVKTTDWAGNPVSAEVGIGVTDLSVLSIAPPNSRTLMQHFYSERGVSVRTSTPLTVSVDKVTQTIIDTIKGGGGGGAESGIFDIREEFVDTPGWEPSLVTDENGEGTFTLTLPDNLTTWRLDARAITSGDDGPMLVGQNTFDLLSTKPLLLRPLTPRFMIVDDVAQFGAIVNNNTGSTQQVEISLEGMGFALVGNQSLVQVVEIPAGGRQRVNWDVRILDVPAVDLTFFANGNDGEFTDATKPTLGQGEDNLLPVYKYEVPETVGTGGFLTEGGSRSEIVALPRTYDITQGELTVEVDRSLAAATIDGLDYLRNFPHQCTEQTVSRFLPNIVTASALQDLGIDDPALAANLDSEVSFALQRLYSSQKVDGGWGWFASSFRSNPIVTAYALIGLIEARNAGYTIDQNVIDRAADYIQGELNTFPRNPDTWRINRQAFLLYAQVRAGFPQESTASRVYELREGMNNDAKAFLALAIHTMNPEDPRLDSLFTDFVGSAVLSSTGAHWQDAPDRVNWTTDTRTTALVMNALIKINPDNALIPQAVRWLMVGRQADAWETTQETAWSVMALTDWMVASGELRPDYEFTVGLNGREQVSDVASNDNVTESEVLRLQVAELLADEANRLTFARTEGEGNLYYRSFLEVYLPVPEVEPVSRGIIIERRYYLDGEPVTAASVGDQLEVVLTVIAPNDLNFVVVEDPIPAGGAAIDPNLLTSSVINDGPSIDRTDPLFYGWGWWSFSRTEIRDEKVVMYADFLAAGTYEYRYTVRLGLPGTYNVIPPTAQEFYFPDVYGRGAGSTFTISPAPDTE